MTTSGNSFRTAPVNSASELLDSTAMNLARAAITDQRLRGVSPDRLGICAMCLLSGFYQAPAVMSTRQAIICVNRAMQSNLKRDDSSQPRVKTARSNSRPGSRR